MKPTNKGLAIGFALATAAALFLAISSRGTNRLRPPELQTLSVPRPANYQWQLTDVDGKSVKLSDFEGRPILLNIWATWCPPCRDEMPSFAKLAEDPRIKKKGVVVLCVSTDEDPAELKAYLKDKPWKMTILRASTPPPPAFQTEFIPATFLIAPDGQIVSSQIGPALWDDPSVVNFLEKLK
jgi:thiol-disulfide isomerase/thioredoxin